ncbi:MAG: hypothetical protein DDT25_00103 [Chloroflexi bacterium]|nr:hypothetical protein [Chloroflexota bacterium]
MMPFLPDQKAITQHHQDSMAMKAFPQPTLVVVIPLQEILAVLVKPLNRPSPIIYLYQILQSSVLREVGGVEFPVALPSGGTLSKEPAQGERGLALQTTIGPLIIRHLRIQELGQLWQWLAGSNYFHHILLQGSLLPNMIPLGG